MCAVCSGSARCRFGGSILAVALAWAVCWEAEAGSQDRAPPRVEAWTGAEALDDVWSVYAGATWAPLGGVQSDGLRLRGVVGHGGYDGGTVEFADLLLGYHWQLGTLTLKALGGLSVADQRPQDAASEPAGTRAGAKGLLEAWWNITDRAWTSLDLAVASPRARFEDRIDYGSRVRLGWRLRPDISLGLEGGSGGPLTPAWHYDTARLGGFFRYEWAGGEISVAGGVGFERPDGGVEEGGTAAFWTVSLLTRF
jgi:hypothetical protein